jgi:hypothetical protein
MPRGSRNLRRLKLVLVSMLALGVIASVTVRGVFALYSGQIENHGGSAATGTLTLENTNALNSTASTTLSGKVGTTTLNGAISASATSITVAANAGFPGSGTYAIVVDNEEMTVTGGQGTNTWTVTRGVNGTQAASHSSGANVYQASIGVAAFASFPGSGDYTVQVDSEKMMVTAGQGTATWAVTRGVDGTAVASHASGAAVSTVACPTTNGTINVIGSCDSVFTFSPAEEWYPGTTAVTNVALKDSGSISARDLEVYMPSCLRGVTADAPWATSTPAAPSFSSASTTGGSLFGGNTYYYEITAVVGGSESVAGTEASYTPPIATNTNQIKLTWAAVTAATSYRIYRSTTEGSEQLVENGVTGTSYTDAATTTLTAAIATTGATSLTVASATGFPASGNYTIQVDSEQMTVTGGQGTTTWTVTRGVNGTTAATHLNGASVTDGLSSAATPPSGTGSGDPCATGNGGLYVQETDSSGAASQCWYPTTDATCTFDGTIDLGLFATSFNTLGQSLDLGAGLTSLGSRYFQIGLQMPSGAGNSLQGTQALITLRWYGQA